MSVQAGSLKFPHTPQNPSGGTAIQVGVPTNPSNNEMNIPAGTVVFYNGKHTGRGLDKVPVGIHNNFGTTNPLKVIGVSIDGVVDPEAAKKYPEQAGRYSVAVSGSVTLCAAIPASVDGVGKVTTFKMPELLDTLYVRSDQSVANLKTSCGHDYQFPQFSTAKYEGFHKVGVVHWVNDNFKNDHIAEVRVHLDVF